MDSANFVFTCLEDSVPPLALEAVRGRASMSEPFVYELELSSELPGGLSAEDIDALFAAGVSIRVEMPDAEAPQVDLHGVVRELEMLPMAAPEVSTYRAVLVPNLWRLSLASGSRVFQEQSGPAVAMQVLEEHGIAYRSLLEEVYPVREYIVQYEEDDLAFVQRLLEHWGVFYFFEHDPDGSTLVLADDSTKQTTAVSEDTVPYSIHRDAKLGSRGAVYGLSRVHRMRSQSIDLKDYNWRTPEVVPEGEAEADASGYGRVHTYGEHIKDASEGAWLARIRAELVVADRQVFRGTTDLGHLGPGATFQLNGHPNADLDIDYLVTEVTYSFSGAGHAFEAEVGFTAIPHAVPYRPARRTPQPRIPGFMHAVVDGEQDGTAAPIDEHGRYRLLLPFDRLAEPGGRATRWVRMAQSSSGPGYGMHLPLHIGCEVALLHLGGDPDRPVIVGTVPNATTVSPVTQADATKSRIRTRSGILIEMEDDGP